MEYPRLFPVVPEPELVRSFDSFELQLVHHHQLLPRQEPEQVLLLVHRMTYSSLDLKIKKDRVVDYTLLPI